MAISLTPNMEYGVCSVKYTITLKKAMLYFPYPVKEHRIAASLPVAELADILHSRGNPWKGLAWLRAYFDESGIHGGSPITAIGGLVGDKETWCDVEAEWLTALDDFSQAGITAFHAVDCEHGEGKFVGLQSALRVALVNRLSRIIADHELLPIWSAAIVSEWNPSDLDSAFLEAFPDPYYLCFAYCAQRLRELSERFYEATKIAVVYSESKGLSGRMGEIWNAYYKNKSQGNMTSFATADYHDCIPLQAADLFAYEMNKHWQETEFGPQRPAGEAWCMRKPLYNIDNGRGINFGGAFDGPAIERSMRRFKLKGEI